LLGDARHWADPLSRERRRAWEQWRAKIFARWPWYLRFGRRPSGWFAFEAPRLIVAAGLIEAELDAMGDLELVHRVDADEKERHEIESVWLGHVHNFGVEKAREIFQVPRWFIDRVEAAPPAEPQRRQLALAR